MVPTEARPTAAGNAPIVYFHSVDSPSDLPTNCDTSAFDRPSAKHRWRK
jgi:hypothetical protein